MVDEGWGMALGKKCTFDILLQKKFMCQHSLLDLQVVSGVAAAFISPPEYTLSLSPL